MRRPSLLHTAAVALVGYGVLGLLVAAAMFAVGTTFLAQLQQWAAPVDQQRGSILQTLRGASLTLGDASDASRDLRTSINSARSSATAGADLARSSAASFRSLEQAMQVTVFGLQPFGAAAPQFGQTAGQLEQTATALDDTARSLSANANDVSRLGTDLATLRRQTDTLASALDSAPLLSGAPASLGLFRIAFYGMCLMVALQSLFSLIAGGALLRQAARRRVDARDRAVVHGPARAPDRAA